MTSNTTTTSFTTQLESVSEAELKNIFKWADLSLEPSPEELRGLVYWEFARRHALECSGDYECDYRPDLG